MWILAACRRIHSSSWFARSEDLRPPGAQSAFIKWTDPQHGKYHWTVHVRRRCGLLSNYFDHLLLLLRDGLHGSVLQFINLRTKPSRTHDINARNRPGTKVYVMSSRVLLHFEWGVAESKHYITIWGSRHAFNSLNKPTCKLPFGQYSVMILCRRGSMHIPTKRTMWSFWRSRICYTRRHSFLTRCSAPTARKRAIGRWQSDRRHV